MALRRLGIILVSFLGAGLMVACSKHHTDGALAGGSQLTAACASSLNTSFDQYVHPFVTKNCASCHTSSGNGKTKFAESSASLAWGQFQTMGMDGITKIYNNAVSASHAPGITGSAIEDEAAIARNNYEITLSNCVTGIDAAAQTDAKVIGLDLGDSDVIVWNLGTEASPSSGLQGAFLFLDVEANANDYYVISNPRIRTGPNAVVIRDIEIYIDGQKIDVATLFKGVDADVPAWTSENSAEGNLSVGSIIIQVPVNPATELQLGFAALSAN